VTTGALSGQRIAPRRRGLEQIPWLYDAIIWAVERAGLDRLRTALVERARGRTLDLGCGTGRNLGHLTTDGLAVGVDPCRDTLVAARRRAPRAALVCASAEALPFADGVFETVMSGLVFCSVTDVPTALGECTRILRPGGRLQMLEHVRASRGWLARFQDLIQPLWTRLAGGCHPNRDTEAAVRAAGFLIPADNRRRVALDVIRLFEAIPGHSTAVAATRSPAAPRAGDPGSA
jgi:ubiquinone/menaquinone biosynthesis C-methylase UbiE